MTVIVLQRDLQAKIWFDPGKTVSEQAGWHVF